MPSKKTEKSNPLKSEAHPREESSVEAYVGIPATPPSSASTTDVAPEASETPPASPASTDVPSPLSFEEFTNFEIFINADFGAKLSLISSLFGSEKACEYFNQVNKMESNGGAAATSPLLTNLQNGAVANTIGGMPSLNQGPQRKRGFEMDALLTQNSEIEALEEEFLKKRRSHQDLLKSMIAKVDVQLEFDKAFLNGTVEENPVEGAAGEPAPEGSGQ